MDCSSLFYKTYGREAQDTFFCPYRICPLGAHVDHNLGIITGFAINKGVHSAFSPAPKGCFSVISMQYCDKISWKYEDTVIKAGDWADYFRGASLALSRAFRLENGIDFCIDGELQTGGLSSSAAVTLSFIHALCKVNGIILSDSELVSLAQKVEHDFVGVKSGILDQSCEVYCRENSLLFLDTDTLERKNIPGNGIGENFDIILFFTGTHRTLVGSGYNNRVKELRDAADLLAGYAGIEWNEQVHSMRRIPEDIFLEYRSLLPPVLEKRALHFFTENRRVLEGADAWQSGDFLRFASLVTESGRSSVYNWQSGSEENICLHEILENTEGIFGSRFSGAGFNSCTLAFAEKGSFERVFGAVKSKFVEKYPHSENTFFACICSTANGISENN